MKILVTGASGFIGGNIVLALVKEDSNYEVIAIGRKQIDKFNNFQQVEYLSLDLTKNLPQIECDVCIHCAGLADDRSSKKDLIEQNVFATQQLINALIGCKTFIFISSSSVYDFSDNQAKKETDASLSDNLSQYGESKLIAEKIIEKSGINSIYILRPRAVYGKGDYTLLPRILKLFKFNKIISPGSLDISISLTHINNLTNLIIAAFKQSKKGIFIYNISDKIVYNLKSIIGEISLKKNGKKSFIRIPVKIIQLILFFNSLFKIRSNISKQSLLYLTQNAVLIIQKVQSDFEFDCSSNFYSSLSDLEI